MELTSMATMFEDLLPLDLSKVELFSGIIITKKPAFINTMEHFHCIIQLWYLQFCFYEVKYPEKIEFKNSLTPPHPLSLRKSYLSFNAALSTTVPSPAPDLLRLQFFAKSKHRFAKQITDWKPKVTMILQ